MLQRQAHSLLEKPIAGLIRTAHSGDNMGPVPFPGGEASFVLPLRDKGAGEVDLVPLIGTGPATFTRATTATTVLSNGLIGSVASGTPRSWYWPDTLAYGGYLAEGARTNLCLQSEDFATTWVSGGANVVTVSGDAAVAPDGNMTADRLTASTGGSSSRAQSLTVAAVVYSFSCFFKADTATSVEFGILQGSFQAVSARIISGPGSVATASNRCQLSGLTAEWTRVEITTNAALVAGSASILIYPSGVGSNSLAIYAWGAQLEAASFASSYIPTTTASVTRNADVLTYVFAGNADATQGTAYAELGLLTTTKNITSSAIGFTTGVEGPFTNASIDAATVIRARDGTNSAVNTINSMATGQRKVAASWGTSLNVTGSGAASVVSTAFDGNMGSTAIAIGTNTNATNPWFGPIKNVKVWKTQVADQNLQLMTR